MKLSLIVSITNKTKSGCKHNVFQIKKKIIQNNTSTKEKQPKSKTKRKKTEKQNQPIYQTTAEIKSHIHIDF